MASTEDDAFGEEIGEVGSDKADRDFDGGVIDFRFHVIDQPGDEQADDDGRDNEKDQAAEPFNGAGRVAGNHESGGDLKRKKTAGVIDEAFALDDVSNRFGQAEAMSD